MSLDEALLDSIAPFQDKGLLGDVLMELKSGKEATVYVCAGGPRARSGTYLAVKIYRPPEHRQFKDDGLYRAGVTITNPRTRRAMEGRTSFGKEALFGSWVGREWANLSLLHQNNLCVPRPIDHSDTAIIMEYLCDELGDPPSPSPQLRSVKLTEPQASACWDDVVWSVETLLRLNRVHGDLSPYNLLWHAARGQPHRPWIIDVPQMIDARENPNAFELLSRDLENVYKYLSRYAALPDPWKLAGSLWSRFKRGWV